MPLGPHTFFFPSSPGPGAAGTANNPVSTSEGKPMLPYGQSQWASTLFSLGTRERNKGLIRFLGQKCPFEPGPGAILKHSQACPGSPTIKTNFGRGGWRQFGIPLGRPGLGSLGNRPRIPLSPLFTTANIPSPLHGAPSGYPPVPATDQSDPYLILPPSPALARPTFFSFSLYSPESMC